MEVKPNIQLLSMTADPGPFLERLAMNSYQTQRFFERVHPKQIKFKSGRVVDFDQFGLEEDPPIGHPLPGYSKDDVMVAEIIQPSWVKVVKFIIAIGHHSLLRNLNATFMFENITRKACLHLLRYEFTHFNFQSQKYKNQGDFEYLLPGTWDTPIPGARRKLKQCMQVCQMMYEDLRKMGLDPEWARSPYPNNIAQTISFTTNFEQFRHMMDCLTDDDYVGENQWIMMQVLKIFKKEAPEFVYDFVISEDGRSATRKGSKYARNKNVNWNLTNQMKKDLGIEVPIVPGFETEID